jgi:tetratricopeptide (TPR) repeat protein
MQGKSGAIHQTSIIVKAIALCFSASLAIAPAFAAGGDGGGSGGSSGGGGNAGGGSAGGSAGGGGNSGGNASGGDSDARSMDMTTCMRGQIWDRRARRCVRARSGLLPDDAVTNYAYALAKAERYGEALETLNLVRNPNTPKALNYRGYATRKLGRLEEGIGYYRKAVALDPKYAQVREYLGEAYVTQGKIDLANEQLNAIKGLCGTDCEEYKDLSEAIEAAPKL